MELFIQLKLKFLESMQSGGLIMWVILAVAILAMILLNNLKSLYS